MKLEICVGSKCTMFGADHIIQSVEDLQETVLKDMEIAEGFELEVSLVKCNNRCKDEGDVYPKVFIDGEVINNAHSQMVMARILEAARKK